MNKLELEKKTMLDLTFQEIAPEMTYISFGNYIIRLACNPERAFYIFWEAVGSLEKPFFILKNDDAIHGIYFGESKNTKILEDILKNTPDQEITLLSAPEPRQVRARRNKSESETKGE